MAIGTPVDRGRAGGTTSATTASFTPTANSLLLAFISTKASTSPSQPTVSDSLSGTWTQIGTNANGPNSNPFIKGGLYYQVVGGSPSSMTVSCNGGSTSSTVAVIEITGAGTDFTNYSVDGTNTAGDPSCTLPNAPTATGAVVGFCAGHLGNTITQAAGFTELYDTTPTGATNHRIEFAYDLSSPSQTLSWTSTNTNSVGIAVEIKEPAASPQTLTPSLFTNSNSFFTPTVNKVVYPLTPGLFTNSQTFYTPTVNRGTMVLTPSKYTNSQTFYTPTVKQNQTLTASLFTNSQSFKTPTITGGSMIKLVGTTTGHIGASATAVNFTDLLDEYGVNNAPVQGDIVLVYQAIQDTNHGVAINPSNPSGYTSIQALNITNSGTFDTNTLLSAKAMTATPDTSVTVSANASYVIHVFRNMNFPATWTKATATGTAGGKPDPAAVTPTHANAWVYVAGASGGGTALSSGGDLNAGTNFFRGTSSGSIAAAAGVKTDWQSGAFDPAQWGGSTSTNASWAAITVELQPASTQALTPSLFTQAGAGFIYTPIGTIKQTSFASLYTNSQTFYSPHLYQPIRPSLFTNNQTFFTETVLRGTITLAPSKYTNSQTFFSPMVGIGKLFPPKYTNTNTFYNAVVTARRTLTASLFTNSNSIKNATVTARKLLTPSRLANNQTFFSPSFSESAVHLPASNLFTNYQNIFTPDVRYTNPFTTSLSFAIGKHIREIKSPVPIRTLDNK